MNMTAPTNAASGTGKRDSGTDALGPYAHGEQLRLIACHEHAPNFGEGGRQAGSSLALSSPTKTLAKAVEAGWSVSISRAVSEAVCILKGSDRPWTAE